MSAPKSDFPYRVLILHSSWSPEVNLWLRTNAGKDQYRYIRPANAARYLRYGFKNQYDALAFKLRFAGESA